MIPPEPLAPRDAVDTPQSGGASGVFIAQVGPLSLQGEPQSKAPAAPKPESATADPPAYGPSTWGSAQWGGLAISFVVLLAAVLLARRLALPKTRRKP